MIRWVGVDFKGKWIGRVEIAGRSRNRHRVGESKPKWKIRNGSATIVDETTKSARMECKNETEVLLRSVEPGCRSRTKCETGRSVSLDSEAMDRVPILFVNS